MDLRATSLPGAYVLHYALLSDARGAFARTFDRDAFAAAGLSPDVVQCNLSRNTHKGTLRGMHYQAAPHGEAKLIRCIRGAVYDVAIDLRPTSPTFTRWEAFELDAAVDTALYLPEGIAHGFLTLTDDAELLYQMSAAYHPASSRGVRWDDPAFGVTWPFAPLVMSDKDRAYPDFAPA